MSAQHFTFVSPPLLQDWHSPGLDSLLGLPKDSCVDYTASLVIRLERVRMKTKTTFLWWVGDPYVPGVVDSV